MFLKIKSDKSHQTAGKSLVCFAIRSKTTKKAVTKGKNYQESSIDRQKVFKRIVDEEFVEKKACESS